jgi:hypothetical protein
MALMQNNNERSSLISNIRKLCGGFDQKIKNNNLSGKEAKCGRKC